VSQKLYLFWALIPTKNWSSKRRAFFTYCRSNHVAAENSFDEARNIIQDVVTGVGDLWQEYSTGCMYGKNCGEKCDLVDPEGIDDLDRSCYLHDCCLSMSTKGTYA